MKHIYHLIETVLIIALLLLLMCYVSIVVFGLNLGVFVYCIFLFLVLLGPRINPRLTMSFFRAIEIPYETAPDLNELVKLVAEKAGLNQVPLLYLIRGSQNINAFSTGDKDNPHIALSEGLLNTLTPRQMVGVLAHEMAHLQCGDTRLLQFLHMVGRFLSLLSLVTSIFVLITLPFIFLGWVIFSLKFLLVVGLCPYVALFLQQKLSRTREFEADLVAVDITNDPQGLACALERIEFFVSYPAGPFGRLMKNKGPFKLLRSHPSTEERIQKIYEYWGEKKVEDEHSNELVKWLKSELFPTRKSNMKIRPPWNKNS